MVQTEQVFEKDYSKFGFHDKEQHVYDTGKGLSEDVVRQISKIKDEPQWMLEFRLRALEHFNSRPMPKWGVDLSTIKFDDIHYYLRATNRKDDNWDDVPQYIKDTFNKLGIPEAEQKFLGGVGAQYDSEVIYHKIRDDLAKQGVIFLDMDSALKQYPEIVKKYFGTIIPPEDNKFAALNTAVWSGGSFVYVPKGVHVGLPLQAYFRINAKNMGQFERTLIVTEPGASVHYIEGCFTKGTPIKTVKGTKKIEDVQEGDHVLTHTGTYKRVYKTMRRKHRGQLCTIRYVGDSRQEMQITGGHPVLCVRRQKEEYKNAEWKPKWVEAGELEKGDYVAIPIERSVLSQDERWFSIPLGRGRHKPKDIDVKITTDKDFFRLVGYYMAEGSISSGHYLNFTFNKAEREYIDDVKDLLERYFGKEPLEYKEYKNGISLVLCSTAATRIFKQQFSSGAKNKSLPSWFMFEDTEKQAEFIKGYWRGDGSFASKQYSWGRKTMFRINTISEKLAEQTRDILLRLNICASINVWKKSAPRNDGFAVYVGGSYLPLFSDLIGKEKGEMNVHRDNEGQVLVSLTQITEDYAFVPISAIRKEDVWDLDVYNFSVEEDESYISHGVVVHNCTAPVYSSDSLHSAVVELIALEGSKIRYTTIQNWSNNVYNLVTKRAFAYKNATVEWVDGNLGSKITMKYPAVWLLEEGARADILSVAFAGKGQVLDAGGKVLHFAPYTTSKIVNKSISKDGGKTIYRGLLKVAKGAHHVKSTVTCDALILDPKSSSDTVPYMEINEKNVSIGHEASVGKVSEEQLFYLMSRGLDEEQAMTMIVSGFIEPFTKELPVEYAVELNRLIAMSMEGSVG